MIDGLISWAFAATVSAKKKVKSEMKRFVILALLSLFWSGSLALAHELWLDADKYQVETGEKIDVSVRNGENFKGISLSYFPKRFVDFYWTQNDAIRHDAKSRAGDSPAFSETAQDDGLFRVIYQSSGDTLTYVKWEKFVNFATHKGFPEATEVHLARGLPQTPIRERYTRYCKALVAVGNGKGADHAADMALEFIALENPYQDQTEDGLLIELRTEGVLFAKKLVEIFERNAEGTLTSWNMTTDANGRVLIPVKAGATYLVDSVVLRPVEDKDHTWESLWAALTFAIPMRGVE